VALGSGSLDTIIAMIPRKSKREWMDFTQKRQKFLSTSAQFSGKKLFPKKVQKGA